MNATEWQESPRVSATLQSVRAMMDEYPPRKIPPQIWRNARSPIARFLLWFGLVMLVFDAVMLAVAVKATPYGLVVAPILLISIAMILYGAWSLALTRKCLASGRLYKGNVITVTPLPAHINGRTFFSAAVAFEGPAGQKLQGKDTVDNFCSDYFLNARDSGIEVEVIYAPNPAGKVLLPMKIASANRYD